jgi:hypothetical protein
VKKQVPVLYSGGEYDIDLTNYQTGDRLVIEGNIAGTDALDAQGLHLYVNSDLTDANYHRQIVGAYNGTSTVSEAPEPRIAVVAAANSSSPRSSFRCVLDDWNVAQKHVFLTESCLYRSNDIMDVGLYATATDDANAVTRIRIRNSNHPTTTLVGDVRCYIESAGILPVTPEPISYVNTSEVVLDEYNEFTTAGRIDFQNIPAGYDRLIVRGYFRTTETTVVDVGQLYFNGDETLANYTTQTFYANNSVTTNTHFSTDSRGPLGGTGDTEEYSTFDMILDGYDDPRVRQVAKIDYSSHKNDGSLYGGYHIVAHDTATAAINRITMEASNHPTDGYLGKVQLIGVKTPSLEASETVTTKIQVATITDPVSGVFDFDLTDYQDGDRIIIEGEVRNTQTGEVCVLEFNGDTTFTNYNTQLTRSGDSALLALEVNEPRIAYVAASGSPANSYGQVKIQLEGYAVSGRNKKALCHFFSRSSATTQYSGSFDMESAVITGPITSLRFGPYTGGNTLTGTLTCYIEKQGILPVTQQTAGRVVTEEIETITQATGGNFDFQNIPAGYKRLWIRGT